MVYICMTDQQNNLSSIILKMKLFAWGNYKHVQLYCDNVNQTQMASM